MENLANLVRGLAIFYLAQVVWAFYLIISDLIYVFYIDVLPILVYVVATLFIIFISAIGIIKFKRWGLILLAIGMVLVPSFQFLSLSIFPVFGTYYLVYINIISTTYLITSRWTLWGNRVYSD